MYGIADALMPQKTSPAKDAKPVLLLSAKDEKELLSYSKDYYKEHHGKTRVRNAKYPQAADRIHFYVLGKGGYIEIERIAHALKIQRDDALYYLRRMRTEGKICSKKMACGVVWFLP